MKLRVIADIHADINKKKNYQFDFGDDFIIACGDISGDRYTTENWIKANIKNGVFVEGNHLGYKLIFLVLNCPKNGARSKGYNFCFFSVRTSKSILYIKFSQTGYVFKFNLSFKYLLWFMLPIFL